MSYIRKKEALSMMLRRHHVDRRRPHERSARRTR